MSALSTTDETEVVIVGGGIGGGVLAALLARGGQRVIVLERNAAPAPVVRPEILWPATAELLFTLAPRAEWEREAIAPLHGVEVMRDGKTHKVFTAEVLAQSGVQPWTTNPAATRALLLALPGIEVRRGVEALGLLREGGRVSGVRTRQTADGIEGEARAAWTVGDDGAASSIRAACGLAFTPALFPVDFFCFTFDWPAAFAPSVARVFANPDPAPTCLLAFAAIPLPGGRGAAIATVRGARFDAASPAPAADWQRFRERTPALDAIAGAHRFPEDFVRIRRPWGHAAEYGVPGAVLLGDALHPVSPAGGQGANMAIHDAAVLAELLLAHHPDVPGEYRRRRHAANTRSVAITARAAAVFQMRERSAFARILSGSMFWLLHQRWFTTWLIRRISTTFLE